MINLKSTAEIKIIATGGKILSKILKQVAAAVKPGITTRELDALAEKLILAAGGTPSFKNYQGLSSDPPYPSTLCLSVNDEVVHTPASVRKLISGDIISLDIGMCYQEFYTDMAVTVPVGRISRAAKKLLQVTKKSLELGVKQVKPGQTVEDIGRAIQTYVENHGFHVVKDLVGHGVGYQVHEDPRVPNFVASNNPKVVLAPGLVIAIEPMVNIGTDKIKFLNDGWRVVTADGSLSAHFEHTVAVTEKGHLVLTE